MKGIKIGHSEGYIQKEFFNSYAEKIDSIHRILHSQAEYGKMPLGWLDLPIKYDAKELEKIKSTARRIKDSSQIFVSIGIGGSYLGSRAAVELLSSGSTQILFAGNNMSGAYLQSVIDAIGDKDFSLCVISKSGTTMETALAFRVLKQLLEKRHGKEEVRERIITVTDKNEGALRGMTEKEGYESYEIPENIGGRYSALTPAALITMAAAGIDIDGILKGAEEAYRIYDNPCLEENSCYQYSALRNIFYGMGKGIEVLINYEPSMAYFGKWWQQLFGESEGKAGKGIFPATLQFTTDLHSMGQYLQEGRKDLFETIISVENPPADVRIPSCADDLDGLNYLTGKTLNYINKAACEGAMKAHEEGGLPVISLQISSLDEHSFGHLVYFMQKACAVSGYLLGINPFDQPGVEMYKKNIYKLLDS